LIKIKEIGDYIFEGKYSLHSTFDNISNFINKNGNIISISYEEKYLSPNSIIISGILHKDVSFIEIDKNEIIINDKVLKYNGLRKYNSKINYENVELKDNLNFTISFIEENINKLNLLSIAFLINEKLEDEFKTGFQKAFVKHIKSAWYKIHKGDFFEGVKKMKGSGHGLTPSGDDFITGMLYALVLIQEIQEKDTTELRNKIYKASKTNNDISRNMIFHASKGLYFKQFKDFQEGLIDKDKNIKQKFENLISIGETSGSDMITGYFLMLKNASMINALIKK